MTSTAEVKDNRLQIQALENLLKKTQDNPFHGVAPEELSDVVTAFLPNQPLTVHSKAYLVLSAICQRIRSPVSEKEKQSHLATEALVKILRPLVVSRLTDPEESNVLAGITFLTSLFQVDWESASSIFQEEGVLECVMDSVDLTPSAALSLWVARLLAQACGHKPCRGLITTQSVQWLEYSSRSSVDTKLRAAIINALIKLSKGTAADTSDTTVEAEVDGYQGRDTVFTDTLKEIITRGKGESAPDAIEGLAYLSVDPVVKEDLSHDPSFLQRLFTLIPRRKAISAVDTFEITSTLLFGVLVIISNICAYRPRLTEEQEQIEKLRRMAKTPKSSARTRLGTSKLDDDENVKIRVRRLVNAGVLDVFGAIVPGTDSTGTMVTAGKVLLSIIEDKENRGKVLQSGGAKILSRIIGHTMSQSSSKAATFDTAYLESIQALAKLAITSSPVQVFGPNPGAIYDAIRPLSLMLLQPSSTLLQRFESIMALTNLSSYSAETASRIAKADGLIDRVELLLLEDHILIRRAAMELICNLIAGSDDIFERYGGGILSSTQSKLQVVLALSDVDDIPTRLAASGALATLTVAPSACQGLVNLQFERHRVLPIIVQLIDPAATLISHSEENSEPIEGHPGLVHRAIICTRNILVNIKDKESRARLIKEADETGLLQALKKITNGKGNEAVLRPAVEALTVMMMMGGKA